MKTTKMTARKIKEMKKNGEKITMLTAYDYPTAKILDDAGIDIILVGDSLGNVVLGYENTLPVTMDEMLHHAKAVQRAVKHSLLIADMPFMSYQLTGKETLRNASRFIKEAGMEAVKIEGDVYIDQIKMIIEAGIPVMGHIGFTPQLVNQIGGYRVQGRTDEEKKILIDSALGLEKAGIFAIVLEMVPEEVTKEITDSIKIPTIGIGAGCSCDGQVLVFHDMAGLYSGNTPKYVKKYLDLRSDITKAVKNYIGDVRSGAFPENENVFHVEKDTRLSKGCCGRHKE